MQIEAPIDRVRVHARGATVTRRITLEDPPAEVTLIGLPLCLADGTVRARLLGSKGTAASVGVTLHVRPPDAVDAPPDAALRAAQREVTRLERALSVQRAERAVFAAVPVLPRAEAPTGRAPQASPFAARVAQEEFIGGMLAERDAAIARLDAELRDANRTLAAAQAALATVSTARSAAAAPITKAVTVRLAEASAGPVTLEVDYRVPGARWAPQYQLRLTGSGDAAEVVMRAVVRQATGEDWRGVALELSTALPQRSATRPTLMALKIGEAQPPAPGRPDRPPPKGAAALFAAYDNARKNPPPNAGAWYQPRPPKVSQPTLWVPEAPAPIGAQDTYAFGGAAEEADDGMPVAVAAGMAADMMMERSAPPPPPAAPRRASRSRGRPAPAPMAKKKARRESSLEDAPDAATGAPTDYANLALAAPTSDTRGQLTRADDVARYVAGLAASGRAVDADAAALVRTAIDRAKAVRYLPSGAQDVRKAAGNYDYVYAGDARIDVAGDGAWHTVPLGVRRAGCRTRYVVVPRLDPGVYRIATLRNPLSAPLLPGEAEVYVDGEYVLSAPVPFVPGRADVELGLGVEQRLRCARNTRFEERRSAEAVVAMTELVHHIEIRVNNGLGRVADCEIRERIPQAAPDAEVVVEEGAVTPAWTAYTQSERGQVLHGGRRWRLEVPAGAETILSAEYVVRIYAKNALVGGNRREA